ncbi:hypothetical protein PLEI_4330 [Photobacterium leiognathi lrivu.4.1]|uniref:Uncharacterized protein n=1 Tax=Photobacterium leiognathi lrivu.4.1 TaxID=1248232 RepID=V5ES88_PHOLE|nr:hypothetical protein PLEI_4330 [Photobacterium leiognathi lrivu.4.1]
MSILLIFVSKNKAYSALKKSSTLFDTTTASLSALIHLSQFIWFEAVKYYRDSII